MHFGRDRIVTENAIFAMSFRLSACISVAPTGQNFVKSYTGSFTKICRKIPNLVQIWKKSDTLYEDLRLFHIFISDVGSAITHKKNAFLCFRGKAFNVCYIVDSNICSSTIRTETLLRFHGSNGYANTPQCYVIVYYPSFLFWMKLYALEHLNNNWTSNLTLDTKQHKAINCLEVRHPRCVVE